MSSDHRTHAPVLSRRPRQVSRPHDPAERQADHAADVVARGGSVSGWSFTTVPVRGSPVHRQEKPKTDEEKLKEGAGKAVEAAAELPAVKKAIEDIKEKALQDPLVKEATKFVKTPVGVATAVGIGVGGLVGLGAAGQALPFQPPEFPLTFIKPGLTGKVTYEGPVNAPTNVGLTLTYTGQVAKGKHGPTEKEQIQADIARLRAQQQMFKPEAEKAADKKAENEFIARYLASKSTLPGVGRSFIPLLPGAPVKVVEPTTDQKAAEEKKPEDAPVQREPASTATAEPAALDTSGVDGAVRGGGRRLEPSVRRSMEARFGYDFGSVRIHDDATAQAAAQGVEASAFTVGHDIIFARGTFDPSSPHGRHLLAHELAHVVQQLSGGPTSTLHRTPAAAPTAPTTVVAGRRDVEQFVDEAASFLESAAAHYRAVADAARVDRATRGAPAQGPAERQAPAQAPAQRADQPPQPQPGEPAAPGLSPERLLTVLDGLRRTYDGAVRLVTDRLDGDQQRADRLRAAYVGAVESARRAATSAGRVNLILIAAPRDAADEFITNATTYARLYFSRVGDGDTLQETTGIDSPDALLNAIETAAPERMMRRIDIFCHGTIEPAHQIRFGATWFTLSQIEAAATARARTGQTLQNQTRFDGSTVIELHACRLGAPDSQPGNSGLPTTHGQGFLSGLGAAAGGQRGQAVIGYEQRWVPRRFAFPGVTSTRALSGARARAFDRIAVQTFDSVMGGSVEVQSQLTEQERAGTPVTEARKIAIMRSLYDAAGGAWLIGHQYSTAEPRSVDPVRDRRRARDTFTNEADWGHHVLQVRVPAPAPVTP